MWLQSEDVDAETSPWYCTTVWNIDSFDWQSVSRLAPEVFSNLSQLWLRRADLRLKKRNGNQSVHSLCFIVRKNISYLTVSSVFMFFELIKHAFSTAVTAAMRWARPVEEWLGSLLVCMGFSELWLQILKAIIQIAATVTGRASVSRTRRKKHLWDS